MFSKTATTILFIVLTCFSRPVQDAEAPPVLNVYGTELTFQSFSSGKILAKTSSGEIKELDFSSLLFEEQKDVMNYTGWGRVWEDNTGKHRTIADLLEVVEDQVILEKPAGGTIVVPIKRLSKADRAYVEARRNLNTEALPDRFHAQVVAIADGDTCTVLLNRRQFKIRISGIDAPETGQDFGTKARKYLGELVHNKVVSGVREDTDKYGRNVCTLEIDGQRVDHAMLKAGLAWHYTKYSDDQSRTDLENAAKSSKVNIWSEAGPIAPWEWRRWGSAKRKQWVVQKEASRANSVRGPPTTNTTQRSSRSTSSSSFSSSQNSNRNSGTTSSSSSEGQALTHWITSSSGIRHNSSCRWYRNSKGRACSSSAGRACKKCGG